MNLVYVSPEDFEKWCESHKSAAIALLHLCNEGEYKALTDELAHYKAALYTPGPAIEKRVAWIELRLKDLAACLGKDIKTCQQ